MSATPADSQAIVRRRTEIARALRTVARQSRAPADFWSGGGGMRARYGHRQFYLALIAAFALLVVLPIVSSAAYLWLIASDQYASEAQFAVRGGALRQLDSLGALT